MSFASIVPPSGWRLKTRFFSNAWRSFRERCMSEKRGYYNFEDFPRGRLAFQVPRRLFLGTLLTEVLVASGEGRGGEGYRLAELGEWADADLALLIPGIANGCEISVEAGFVCGRLPNRRQSTRLFPGESHAPSLFNPVDGQAT